jgi:ADP-dependent NAD(P)H-hydrate dehydratase / NAD(P)H-hydrate epimerase
VIPVVTPAEMGEIDAAAPEPVEELIERAGAAVARAAVALLGGTYGRRVVVIAGKGNNGNDGRAAARRLGRRGVSVRIVEAADVPARLDGADLVIDAAYGTGFRGSWDAPHPGDAMVLAVDIPSGVDGLTGEAGDGVLHADRTVTFAALKPGLLLPPGSIYPGEVEVADIGLDVSRARSHLVTAEDVGRWLLPRAADTHKWHAAVAVVAGSPGMSGAARLVTAAALRTGAGYVRLSTPGGQHDPGVPTEAVTRSLPPASWAGTVTKDLDRFKALVVGPGLGRSDATTAEVRELVAAAQVPVVVDGDGLFALAWSADGAASLLRDRPGPTVLTPHDGEYGLLAGRKPGADRLSAARDLAAATGAVVLLKGPATVVAEPAGAVLLSTAGDERLATAGTGDVLSGIVGALLAQQVPAFKAAAAAAWLHGRAAQRGPARGLIASDLPALLPGVLESL